MSDRDVELNTGYSVFTTPDMQFANFIYEKPKKCVLSCIQSKRAVELHHAVCCFPFAPWDAKFIRVLVKLCKVASERDRQGFRTVPTKVTCIRFPANDR